MSALRGAWAMPVVLAAAAGPALVSRADVPPPDYDFQWANISDRNNAPYAGPGNTTGRGSVSYAYRMSKLEITTAQWADFLNMALRDHVDLNNPRLRPAFWGASQVGGFYVANEPMRPVIGLNWRAGAYYANWLNNGKQESWASCQSGAYDAAMFGGGNNITPYTDQLTHSPGAKFWIPTLDEWLKAAHYDPNKNGTGQGGWWTFCYGSDSAPVPGAPGVGETSAGYHPGGFGELFIPLGAYTSSKSPYGLWDLSGGASEWLEEPLLFQNGGWNYRWADGSHAGDSAGAAFDHISTRDGAAPITEGFFGFRIASQIPAPSVVTVAFVGSAGFLRRRRR